MGTKRAEPETPRGYIQQVGHQAGVIQESAADIAYGRRGGSLWPVLLVFIAMVGLFADTIIISAGCLAFLGIWVGGKR